MTNIDPLILRCLALTGSFETGKLPPGCFPQASIPPEPDEHEFLCQVATAIADVCNPRFRQDVLERKMMIANGLGIVHGLRYDLARDFSL